MDQKQTFKHRLVKKYVTRIIAALMAEFIPLVNYLPMYTIDAVTIFVENELTRRWEQRKLKDVEAMEKDQNKKNAVAQRKQRQELNDIHEKAA